MEEGSGKSQFRLVHAVLYGGESEEANFSRNGLECDFSQQNSQSVEDLCLVGITKEIDEQSICNLEDRHASQCLCARNT